MTIYLYQEMKNKTKGIKLVAKMNKKNCCKPNKKKSLVIKIYKTKIKRPNKNRVKIHK